MESFVFDSYSVDETRSVLSFVYESAGQKYTEKLYLPKSIPGSFDAALLDTLLLSLHIALGISYWKMRCIPSMQIKSGSLTSQQARFWTMVYSRGLGEFFFRNKIDFRKLIAFPSTDTASPRAKSLSFLKRELVGIGGGKDSVVTWERLKKDGIAAMGLIIETQKKYDSVNKLLEVGKIPVLRVRREMDRNLVEQKNNSLYHNGHVPISMIYAFIGILCAVLYDYRAFVVSNEKSADEGNTQLYGMPVNHQWSKSTEFENAFLEYIHEFISPDISYYSPLRSLSELEIVGELMSYPAYLPAISSCNRVFSVTNALSGSLWCGKCPKCAFAFLMLAAYMPKKDVIELFGTNMFADPKLKNLFQDLLGKGDMKPFDCVGTFEEANEALGMIKKKGEFKLDAIL